MVAGAASTPPPPTNLSSVGKKGRGSAMGPGATSHVTPKGGGQPALDSASLVKPAAIFRELILNHVSELSYDNLCARMARRFLLSKWASGALQDREDLRRCVSPPRTGNCA